MDRIRDWMESFENGDRLGFATVLNADPLERIAVYHKLGADMRHHVEWLQTTQGPLQALLQGVQNAELDKEARPLFAEGLPTGPYALVLGLVMLPDLVTEEPLREMLDDEGSIGFRLYRALWTIRFTYHEQGWNAASQEVFALMVWLTRRRPNASQMRFQLQFKLKPCTRKDMLEGHLFLLLLAAQNGLIRRLLLTLDSVERASSNQLRLGLSPFLSECGRWAEYPKMPLGILLGWDGRSGAILHPDHHKLFNLLIMSTPG